MLLQSTGTAQSVEVPVKRDRAFRLRLVGHCSPRAEQDHSFLVKTLLWSFRGVESLQYTANTFSVLPAKDLRLNAPEASVPIPELKYQQRGAALRVYGAQTLAISLRHPKTPGLSSLHLCHLVRTKLLQAPIAETRRSTFNTYSIDPGTATSTCAACTDG